MKVRSVTVDDAAQIREIYRPYIEESPISFETEAPSEEEMKRRIQTMTLTHPWLVLERDEKVVAYAYAGIFKARAAYDWTVETTVYVHQDLHGQGLGQKIYLALFDELRKRRIVNAIAVIALPNDPSVLFHERLGFRHAGRLAGVGFKLGRWWDIGYWQLHL